MINDAVDDPLGGGEVGILQHGQFIIDFFSNRPIAAFDLGVVGRGVRTDEMVAYLHGVEGLDELAGDVAGAVIALDGGPLARGQRADGRGCGDRDAAAIHEAKQLVMDNVSRVNIEEGQQVVIPLPDLDVADVGLPLLIGSRGWITATGARCVCLAASIDTRDRPVRGRDRRWPD